MSTVNAGWRGPNIVKEGLVLYLDASSGTSYSPYNSGTTWRDISGNNNNGTLTNGPVYNTANGGSFVFDGIDDIVSTSNYTYSTNFYSQFVWFKFISEDSGAYKYVIDQEGSRIILAIKVAGTNCLGAYNVNQGSWITVNTSAHLDGNWKYIGVTNSNGNLTFFINGSSIGTGVIAAIPTIYNKPIGIGGYFLGGGMAQLISTTQIYNRALSAQEVQQNYNATKGRFGL